ncbi:hypothetical protein DV735_g759, partial [Chaetothyriales sp. CBS 134920]
MASATDDPEQSPQAPARSEEQPLLGRPGDVTQRPGQALYVNLLTGTAILGQVGIWLLASLVWSAVFEANFIFFSYHPILQTAGIVLLTQSILVLQPTTTPKQKRDGTWAHAAFNALGFGALVAGMVVIELNKASHPETRFTSVHGILGLVTFVLIVLQVLVGIVQYWLPGLVGGVENGKAIYKYHRVSGYAILLLALATIITSTSTGFNINVLHIRLWAVVAASVLVLAGVIPRIKKRKFGF